MSAPFVRTLDVTEVSVAPKPLTRTAPHYPAELRRSRATGKATIDLIVDERGQATNITVAQASEPAFGRAGAEAVARWTFSPGLLDGKPVRTHLQIPLIFSLDEH